jgi:hypothetical protein
MKLKKVHLNKSFSSSIFNFIYKIFFEHRHISKLNGILKYSKLKRAKKFNKKLNQKFQSWSSMSLSKYAIIMAKAKREAQIIINSEAIEH